MKRLLLALMMFVLTACGSDVNPTVNCQGPCVDIDEPKEEKEPKEPENNPNPNPTPTPKTEVERKDYSVRFTFKVSLRKAQASDFCDSLIESELTEADVNFPDDTWKCNGDKVYVYGVKSWSIVDFNSLQGFAITKEIYDDLKLDENCQVTGDKMLTCSITDNFVTVHADRVDDSDYKVHLNVNWNIYYKPKFNF